MDNLTYYIALLLLIIIGFLIVKKMAGCLVRIVVMAVLVAVFTFIYYKFFR